MSSNCATACLATSGTLHLYVIRCTLLVYVFVSCNFAQIMCVRVPMEFSRREARCDHENEWVLCVCVFEWCGAVAVVVIRALWCGVAVAGADGPRPRMAQTVWLTVNHNRLWLCS